MRCSDNVHNIHYRLRHKDPALNAKILDLCVQGMSNRKIARFLDLSEHSVRIRMERLARRALEFHHHASVELKIKEPVAFDGLENFAGSQYDPSNVQQAVGRNSLFIYDFNFAPLNRKGRTSVWQKRRLDEITKKHGRYDPQAIRVATKTILSRLQARRAGDEKILLLSDEHFQYRRALQELKSPGCFEHKTVSSRACRNFQNILFSVNHADLLIRQNMAAFSRETIAFSKTPGRMCQKYALFMVHKNYMCPQFTKKQVRRCGAHLKSPAEFVGLSTRILGFQDIFHHRSLLKNTKPSLNTEWMCFWNGQVPRQYTRSRIFS